MILIIILAVILLVTLGWLITTSNNFKRYEIKVAESLSGIEVALAKRYDVLTKLLATTKKFAQHEKEMLREVIQLRQGMSIGELTHVTQQMDQLTERINLTAEAYPELRSSEIFHELQRGIRDVEEHLQAARRVYNAHVARYNTSLVVFPANKIANFQQRQAKEFFVMEEQQCSDVLITF
ncbi:LemA family protein [Enterococcus nangangensis]|uniref:LemA family protein n=1 Tax=Enterococcus nangangensis TaxID=2559926 RepID=UPI0010F6A424|nr:LemA family protein [Enterococcus nangangensis]